MYRGRIAREAGPRRLFRWETITAVALWFGLVTGPQPSWAECNERWIDAGQGPDTNLDVLLCGPGEVQRRELQVFTLYAVDGAWGKFSVSSVVVVKEGDSAQGLSVKVGPYGQYNTTHGAFVDEEELAGLQGFLQRAIYFSSRPPNSNERLSAVIQLRTKDGVTVMATQGDLGAVSVRVRYSESVALGPEDAGRLLDAVKSALQTLAQTENALGP